MDNLELSTRVRLEHTTPTHAVFMYLVELVWSQRVGVQDGDERCTAWVR